MSSALIPDAAESGLGHPETGLYASRSEPLPRVRDETQKRVRDWILALPKATGKSLTKIAEEAGVAVTTLTKPANNPDHKHVTSTVTIAKIVETHGVAPPLGFEHLRPMRGLAEPEAQEYRYDAEPDIDGLIKAYIAGRPSITAWVLKTRALDTWVSCLAISLFWISTRRGVPAISCARSSTTTSGGGPRRSGAATSRPIWSPAQPIRLL